MDPTATLDAIRAMAAAILAAVDADGGSVEIDPVEGTMLAERITDLDQWLTRGGFLPNQWRATR